MEINGVYIEDTFAEAFPIWVSRVLITAATKKWAKIAATEATGFGCSVIMCPAEAGIEKYVPPSKTPDGRPGFIIQICHPKKSELEHQMLERLGQCVLTCPTTAIFDAVGDMADEQLKVGFKLKFFGDGYEKKDELYGRKVYKIPIMGGEFITEAKFGIKKGVAGGNFFIMADTNASALIAAVTPRVVGFVMGPSAPGAARAGKRACSGCWLLSLVLDIPHGTSVWSAPSWPVQSPGTQLGWESTWDQEGAGGAGRILLGHS